MVVVVQLAEMVIKRRDLTLCMMIKIVNVSQRQGLTCGYLESIALDCLA